MQLELGRTSHRLWMMPVPQKIRRKCVADRGFTLVELLVVVAIIGLLISLLLFGLGRVRGTAQLTECMSNQHQLQVGLVGWSQDNNGKFMSPSNDTPPEYNANVYGPLNPRLFWVRNDGINQTNGPRTETDSSGMRFETLQALEDGALWDYIGNHNTYRSPLDRSGRVRSYALNGFISDLPDNPSDPDRTWGPVADRISLIKNPANTLYTIGEEDPGSGFNRGGFVLNIKGNRWKDIPSYWTDDGRFAVSFVDGSSRIATLKNVKLAECPLVDNEQDVTDCDRADFLQLAEWLDVTR